LGGEEFDLRVINYSADEFKRKAESTCAGPLACKRLKEGGGEVESRALLDQQTEINLPYIKRMRPAPKHLNMNADPGQARGLGRRPGTKDHGTCRIALKDAGLSHEGRQRGHSRGRPTSMRPMVQQAVKDMFGREPRRM